MQCNVAHTPLVNENAFEYNSIKVTIFFLFILIQVQSEIKFIPYIWWRVEMCLTQIDV